MVFGSPYEIRGLKQMGYYGLEVHVLTVHFSSRRICRLHQGVRCRVSWGFHHDRVAHSSLSAPDHFAAPSRVQLHLPLRKDSDVSFVTRITGRPSGNMPVPSVGICLQTYISKSCMLCRMSS